MRKRPLPHNKKRPPVSGNNYRFESLGKDGSVVLSPSFLAHIRLKLCHRDKNVFRCVSFPMEVFYNTTEGKETSHIPALAAYKLDGTVEIYDVVRSKSRRKESMKLREAAVLSDCQSKGWKYFVDTEDTLPGPTETVNICMLYGFEARCFCNSKVRHVLLHDIEIGVKWRIKVLTKQLASNLGLVPGDIMATIWWMIWHQELETDMSILLAIAGEPNRKAVIWRKEI